MKQEFAWKYFHFFDGSKNFINVIVHFGHILGTDFVSYVTITGFLEELGHIRERADISSKIHQFKSEQCSVHPVEKKDGTGYRSLSFAAGKMFINLSYRLEKLGWQASSEVLMSDKSDMDRKNFWAVDSLDSAAELNIHSGTSRLTMSGKVYADRQWGTLAINEIVDSWNWLHASGPSNKSFVAFTIHLKSGLDIIRFISKSGSSFEENQDTQIYDLGDRLSLCNTDDDLFVVPRSESQIVRDRLEDLGSQKMRYRRWLPADVLTERNDNFVIVSEKMEFWNA